MLYMGWIQSLLFFNSPVVLSTSSKSDIAELQTSCNAGIRAVIGLPKYGYADITTIRAKLNIPSVESIVEYSLQVAAWKKFANSSVFEYFGPSTRSRSNGNFPHPDQKGQRAMITDTILKLAWNRIPLPIKLETKLKTAKREIKKFLF